MTDETQTEQPPETREAKRARQLKARISDICDEMIEAMEEARGDGFGVNFNFAQGPDGKWILGHLNLTKTW